MPEALPGSLSFPVESTLPAPVLVVEDEPLLQQRLRGVLLQLGYAPDALVFAASLGEARACLRRSRWRWRWWTWPCPTAVAWR